MNDEMALVRAYARDHSEGAFAALVSRYINLVYSVALRQVGDPHLAEEATQAAFILLARKAGSLGPKTILSGWLCRTARYMSADALRSQRRRQKREQEACMQSLLNESEPDEWNQIAPLLETAMAQLGEQEHNAIVLRFYEGKGMKQVGDALGTGEDAARMRVNRALEKLRKYFADHGITLSTSVLAAAVSTHAVQAAPAGLAGVVTGASLVGAANAASSGVWALLKNLLAHKPVGAWMAAALVTGVAISILIATAYSAFKAVNGETLRKGLVLHYSFDRDETATGVQDGSGSGNHGQASGVRWTAQGRSGGAYEFNADGDEIRVPNHDSLNPKQLTLAAWIKTSTADGKWRRIFDKSFDQGYALSVAADWNGKPLSGRAGLEIGPAGPLSVTQDVVADGQWHHLVATFDGARQVLYLDGAPNGKPGSWKPPGRVGKTAFDLVIGCNRSNPREDDLGVSFRGLIDEPMMWNRALSPKEVAFLFESQRLMPTLGPPGKNKVQRRQ